MLLYNSPVSGNCYKVRLIAAHLGIPLELKHMDVVDRSNRREVLGELNPALRVPTLVLDDGRPLAESAAIIWHLAEGSRFIPADAYERAQVLQWMFFEQYELEPSLAVVRFLVAYSGRADEHRELIEQRTKSGRRVLDALEAHIGGREWFVGDTMTLADVALYAYTHVAPEGGFDLEPYPGIRAWLERVASQSGTHLDHRIGFALMSYGGRPWVRRNTPTGGEQSADALLLGDEVRRLEKEQSHRRHQRWLHRVKRLLSIR